VRIQLRRSTCFIILISTFGLSAGTTVGAQKRSLVVARCHSLEDALNAAQALVAADETVPKRLVTVPSEFGRRTPVSRQLANKALRPTDKRFAPCWNSGVADETIQSVASRRSLVILQFLAQ